jgi:hypothetical protein
VIATTGTVGSLVVFPLALAHFAVIVDVVVAVE